VTYRLTPQAIEDIDGITLAIFQDNPNAALDLVESFAQRWELAVKHPYSGASRDDLLPGMRHLVVGSYLTFYRIVGRDIEIVRVLHGRRNLAREIAGD
jgi:toxin ParE1/3/4